MTAVYLKPGSGRGFDRVRSVHKVKTFQAKGGSVLVTPTIAVYYAERKRTWHDMLYYAYT